MEKEPCTKFCGVLICSHKVIKLKILNPAREMPYARMYKTFHPRFYLHIYVNFMEKEPFTQFYGRFNHFK